MSLTIAVTFRRRPWELSLGGPAGALLYVDCPWFGLDAGIASPRRDGEPLIWTASHAPRSRTGRFLFIQWTADRRSGHRS